MNNDHHGSSNQRTPPAPGHAVHETFRRFAHWSSAAVGSPAAFMVAVLVIIAWAITGPLFRFSDTWQLVINTGTTIVTFLTVFLIQNTQNRDARAIHLKLDELIRSKKGARNTVIDLESVTDEEMIALEKEFKRLRERGATAVERHVHAAERRAAATERVARAEEREAQAEEREADADGRKTEAKTKEGAQGAA